MLVRVMMLFAVAHGIPTTYKQHETTIAHERLEAEMDLESAHGRGSEEPEEVGELMDEERAVRPKCLYPAPRKKVGNAVRSRCADQRGQSEDGKMKIDCSQWYEVVRGNQVNEDDTPIMCRNVSPKRFGKLKDSWRCTTTNAGFGPFKKKTTTPCVPGDDWDNVQRRKALVKLWNDESFAEVGPSLLSAVAELQPDGCDVAAEVEAAAGTFTNEYVEPVATVGNDPDNLLPKFQAMVDRTTRRESLLVGGDYKLKAPAQTEFNTMEVVGVYRLVDKVHWQLYTARKKLLRRMGVVPDGTVEGETNERLEGKVLSTPRDDDEAGLDTLLAELTKLGSPGGAIHPNQAALDADLNEVFLFHGTAPETVPKIIAGGANERFGSLVGLFGAGNYFAELASKADQYSLPFKCPTCHCAWASPEGKGEAGVFPIFLSRVALGRTYGGLNAGRSDEPPVVPDFGQRFKVSGGVFNAKDIEGGRLFRKALDVQSKGWAAKKKGTMPVSVIGAGCNWGFSSTQSEVNKGGCKKDPERDNDGLEFVAYDGSQAYMQYILLYRRVVKRGAENKLEWDLPITVNGPDVTVVLDPLELSQVEVGVGISGKSVKRKRVLAKYEDIANVDNLLLPSGYHLGINAPDDFKEELTKRLDYFHRRQR